MRRLLIILIALTLSANAQQTQTQPTDAAGWFRFGIARHDAGDYAGALAAYAKAEAMNFGQSIPLWMRQARANAKLGHTEEALALLKKLTDNGFGNPEQLNAENDFLSLRTDKRFAEAVTAARNAAHPCQNAPEFRQFDYWLGEWDVESNGQKIARSSIQLILDDCVIFENYYAGPYSGKSFSLYMPSTKTWQQYYTDTRAYVSLWDGKLENGNLRMLSKQTNAAGQVTLSRMTYIKEGPDKVRQLIETSTDDGKTWTPGYDGLYTRRK